LQITEDIPPPKSPVAGGKIDKPTKIEDRPASASDRRFLDGTGFDSMPRLSSRFSIFLLVCLLKAGTASDREVDVSQLFQAGNQFYSQGNFKAAIDQYLRIIQSNFVNEDVYYNLANAFFKDNQLGKAILYYERAKELAPQDREISENLSLAQNRIVDKVERPQEGFLLKQANRLLNLLPLDQQTMLAVILFVVANGLFTVFMLMRAERLRRIAFTISVSMFFLFLLLGSMNATRIYYEATTQNAIVLLEKVDVLSGPSTDNPTLFSIHEGLKVNVQTELNGWAQITLHNGWNGWVRKESVGLI
jgi:tetratricopeptide (TPR) repeat protein